ncbi:MAG: TRAP transporter large permease subunit [Rhodospirillaceae bacterium]|jgi:tripartite ATP-independent transporter DctM subunit|nr:TRAP transporter large permease subunit [Rhodospirillaceae bacterium]MBT5455224.1 TRAP transporter large permease subunit [Rhodospirillaceae bacterium]
MLIDALPLLMFTGLAVFLFSGFPVAFVLGGLALGFGLIGMAAGVFEFVEFYNIVPRIWGGIAENLILVAIPMFILMGTLLERSGVAAELLRSLDVLLRRVPGGLALAVTMMGTIMAATTGIIGASVVMMTVLALPAMLQARYDAGLASGTVAAAGTLGILIPPSIMLVVMAELLSKSVGTLFFAAFMPGLLLAGLYTLYVTGIAICKPAAAPRRDSDQSYRIFRLIFVGLLPPTALICLVLGSILAGWASPTEAAGVGAFGALLLALVLPRLTPSERGGKERTPPRFGALLTEALDRAALTGGMLFAIFIGATAFSLVFQVLGGDQMVEALVEGTGFGAWGVLVLLMAIVFVLGFFLDWIEITLITLPIFVPIVELLDFGAHVAKPELLYWFAVLMAINLQTSFLTPPFGFALFYLKGAAPSSLPMETIWRGAVPFVALQLVALALVAAFPDIALWLPRTYLN